MSQKKLTVVLVKNKTLLSSIRDYFYQRLYFEPDQDFDQGWSVDGPVYCEHEEDLHTVLKQLDSNIAMVIQEGTFFYEHLHNNFIAPLIKSGDLDKYSLIGHILDHKERYYQLHKQCFIINLDHWNTVGAPDFNSSKHQTFIDVKRSESNFHDDYTPHWIEAGNGMDDYEKCKTGAKVIGALLKEKFKVRPFNQYERILKTFVYYFKEEQVSHLLNSSYVNDDSYYYPRATSKKHKKFKRSPEHFISVANGLQSLQTISNCYESIKEISFYDISMPALIFTELLLEHYHFDDYIEFVKEFDTKYNGEKFTTLPIHDKTYHDLLGDIDMSEYIPIIKHIRNNVKVNYHIGDITRTSIIENLDKPTAIYLSNSFHYSHSLIRKSELDYYESKISQQCKIKDIDIETIR